MSDLNLSGVAPRSLRNANSAFNTEYGSTSLFTAAPTATTFALRNNSATAGGVDHIAYCWHGVDGYSKFGSYTGNGSTNGQFVYTGFKPSFIILKSSSNAVSWYIFDNKRNLENVQFFRRTKLFVGPK